MRLDLSLWSADLTAPGEEIKRLEGCADSFHFDVADGHFVPALLFFPDLLAQLRPLTRRVFHIHLMTARPDQWVAPFLAAGADWISVHAECPAAAEALDLIRRRGKRAGLALLRESPLPARLPGPIDTLLLLGTAAGIKGEDLEEGAAARIRAARARWPRLEIVADGGIRAHTVEDLARAGADWIVPGSLVCGAADPRAAAARLRGL